MRNTFLTKSSVRAAVLSVAVRGFFFGILLLQCFLLHTPVLAQGFVPQKFDKSLIEESLQDQAILREEMLLDQAILREEMEQIRLEIQRIMKEIALSMKEEALKLKAELHGLQAETQRIQKEIMAALEKSKQDFIEGQEEMRKELKKMRQEAKTMTKEIKVVLAEQKEIWQQETTALKGSLVEARKEIANSDDILQSSRSAINEFKKEKEVTMADSRTKSNAAMFEAGVTFKKSQHDYKKDSANIARELMADIKKTRETLQLRQRAQKRSSKAAQQEILAALKIAKKKRVAELTQDSIRNKLQRKKNSRTKQKQTQKRERIKKIEKRKAVLKKAKTERRQRTEKRKAEYRKTQKNSKIKVRKNKSKKRLDSRKAKKQIKKKLDSIKSVKEDSFLQGSQENQDKTFNKEFDEKEKIEKKPQQKKLEEDKEELVIVADAPTKTSEEPPQVKASRFSKNITSLKNDLKKENGDPGALLAKLGDAYLEAQRFLGSQKDNEERQKILDLSDNQNLLLGSYEQAAWAYKLSLGFNHKNAETHLKIGKIYDEMGDGQNAIMHAKLAHQILKKRDNSRQMEEAKTFIEKLTLKYKGKSKKNSA